MSEVTIDNVRRAAAKADSVIMPDGRKFRIMWCEFDAFGVRNPGTAEQYLVTMDEALEREMQFLVLCPIDLANV